MTVLTLSSIVHHPHLLVSLTKGTVAMLAEHSPCWLNSPGMLWHGSIANAHGQFSATPVPVDTHFIICLCSPMTTMQACWQWQHALPPGTGGTAYQRSGITGMMADASSVPLTLSAFMITACKVVLCISPQCCHAS